MMHKYMDFTLTMKCSECEFEVSYPVHNFDPGTKDVIEHHKTEWLPEWNAHKLATRTD